MDPRRAKQLVDEITLWILSQSAPLFPAADSAEQRGAAQAVWRRHRDEVLDQLDELETGLGLGML